MRQLNKAQDHKGKDKCGDFSGPCRVKKSHAKQWRQCQMKCRWLVSKVIATRGKTW